MAMIFAGIQKPPFEGIIPRYFRTCAQGDVPVCSSNCAVRKEVFVEMNGFMENLVYGEDQDLWGRIALYYPVVFSWNGSAIYHTEANGRTCNDAHTLTSYPLSVHLKELLVSGSIEPQLAGDLRACIRRRQKTILLSNVLHGSSQERNRVIDQTKMGICMMKSFSSIRRGGILLFRMIYHSRFHNLCRMFWCYLHGWHVPRLEKT